MEMGDAEVDKKWITGKSNPEMCNYSGWDFIAGSRRSWLRKNWTDFENVSRPLVLSVSPLV